MLDPILIGKLASTVVIVLAFVLITALSKRGVNRFVSRRALNEARARFASKVLFYTIAALAMLALLAVWEVGIRNVGVFISSIIGLVAIGFFAVWSILSNIVAGFFLFFSDPFRIGDEITILPEDISGQVTDIKLLFVVLQQPDSSVLHVPNNLIFQKVVKRLGKTVGPTAPEA